MPRPRHIIPKAHLHITMSADLREKLDNAVWSELEQRIPAGALQKFIEERLREYFSFQKLEVGNFLLGGKTLYGDADTLELLREFLTTHNEGAVKNDTR
jgi:hypothetical protein